MIKERSTGWKMTEEGLQSNLSHLEPDDQTLAVWCYRWCNNPEHPLTLAEFAKQIGTAENTTYKVFSGKYFNADNVTLLPPPPKMLAGMREFKRLEEEREKSGAVRFCKTTTATKIFLACDLAKASRTPVFLSGASHIGKTMAFREYSLQNTDSRSYYVRMRSASGVVGMVKLIAKALGINGKLTKDRLVDAIIQKLTPNSLLILDECHLLTNTYRRESFFNCFETLRDIYDLAGCGVVLSFTNIGREKVEQEKRGELEQLFRRGVHRFSLGDQPLANDLRMIVRGWGMEFPKRADEIEVQSNGQHFSIKPFTLIKDLSKTEGLKSITERLRYARKLSGESGEDASWEHFFKAHLIIEDHSIAPPAWN